MANLCQDLPMAAHEGMARSSIISCSSGWLLVTAAQPQQAASFCSPAGNWWRMCDSPQTQGRAVGLVTSKHLATEPRLKEVQLQDLSATFICRDHVPSAAGLVKLLHNASIRHRSNPYLSPAPFNAKLANYREARPFQAFPAPPVSTISMCYKAWLLNAQKPCAISMFQFRPTLPLSSWPAEMSAAACCMSVILQVFHVLLQDVQHFSSFDSHVSAVLAGRLLTILHSFHCLESLSRPSKCSHSPAMCTADHGDA